MRDIRRGIAFAVGLGPHLVFDIFHVAKLARAHRPKKNAPCGKRHEEGHEEKIEGDIHQIPSWTAGRLGTSGSQPTPMMRARTEKANAVMTGCATRVASSRTKRASAAEDSGREP